MCRNCLAVLCSHISRDCIFRITVRDATHPPHCSQGKGTSIRSVSLILTSVENGANESACKLAAFGNSRGGCKGEAQSCGVTRRLAVLNFVSFKHRLLARHVFPLQRTASSTRWVFHLFKHENSSTYPSRITMLRVSQSFSPIPTWTRTMSQRP